jgi:hypothetical protein
MLWLKPVLLIPARLLMLALVAAMVWMPPASAQPQQSGANCRDDSDAARITELQGRIATYEARLREGQGPLANFHAELEAFRIELAALLAKQPCGAETPHPSPGMSPSPGIGGSDPGRPSPYIMNLGADQCNRINCDCDNLSWGLLTRAYRRTCRATEQEMKETCEETRGLLKNKCHSIATGPNPFPK